MLISQTALTPLIGVIQWPIDMCQNRQLNNAPNNLHGGRAQKPHLHIADTWYGVKTTKFNEFKDSQSKGIPAYLFEQRYRNGVGIRGLL